MQVRDELIDAVCKREMGVYTQIFSTMGETAKLERTVNRWALGLLLNHPEAEVDLGAGLVGWRHAPPATTQYKLARMMLLACW